MAMLPTIKEMSEEVAARVLDEYIYEGKTLRQWIDALAQTKWIPVSEEMSDEELPENFQRVLITVVNYAGDKVVRSASYINLRRTFRVAGSSNIWEVGEKGLLAWKPLPEPYKQQESENET